MEANVGSGYDFIPSLRAHWSFIIGAPANGISCLGAQRKNEPPKKDAVASRPHFQAPASSRE